MVFLKERSKIIKHGDNLHTEGEFSKRPESVWYAGKVDKNRGS